MTEAYPRKPAPPDWPRPASIITRAIDASTRQLQTPFCPRESLRSEFFIPGTEPTLSCDRHMGFPATEDTVYRPHLDTSAVIR